MKCCATCERTSCIWVNETHRRYGCELWKPDAVTRAIRFNIEMKAKDRRERRKKWLMAPIRMARIKLLNIGIWYCEARWNSFQERIIKVRMDCDRLIEKRNRWEHKKSSLVHLRYRVQRNETRRP